MRTTLRPYLIAGLFALVATIAPLAHAAAPDLAGVWKGTMETQIGPAETTITIEPGAALAGKVRIMEYEGAIEKGAVDGEKITFEVTIQPGTIAYTGTVKGDEMTLEVTGTRGDKMSLVAKRQK